MREIKFREFDKKKKEFVFYPNGIQTTVMLDGSKVLKIEEEDIEFLLFTGLKDKNSVDIYEGDILKKVYTIDVTALGEKSVEIETHKIIGYVKFEKGHFGIYFTKHTANEYAENTFYPFINEREYEIIGNIFENPELLEKVK